ncbi:hypothetical protein OPV22_003817 [Ensete ventricosum]|uniref:Uncharacterized protein n=1 Tax=Ensete ventricosum TaxID=4639 RepID=A0AAV8S1X9_ENSVE|nr:hypothetical protein OPV22_003817 [Ensete ventricosum]RZS12576.1 hypothetical protein BHM03_00044042 [Ensete ventricosum]
MYRYSPSSPCTLFTFAGNQAGGFILPYSNDPRAQPFGLRLRTVDSAIQAIGETDAAPSLGSSLCLSCGVASVGVVRPTLLSSPSPASAPSTSSCSSGLPHCGTKPCYRRFLLFPSPLFHLFLPFVVSLLRSHAACPKWARTQPESEWSNVSDNCCSGFQQRHAAAVFCVVGAGATSGTAVFCGGSAVTTASEANSSHNAGCEITFLRKLMT